MPIFKNLGDGGPIFQGPYLVLNPDGVECGQLLVGSDNLFTILIQNQGDKPLHISNVTTDDDQLSFPDMVLPIIVPVNTSVEFTVQVTPTAAITEDGVVSFVSNSPNNPVLEEFIWTGFVTGKAISVDPTAWTFPNEKVGNESDEKVFGIVCTGDLATTVTAVNFPTDWVIGGTVPTLPAILNPGDIAVFGAKFKPLSDGYLAEEIEVVSDAAESPFIVKVTGTAYLIDSAYILDGFIPGWFIAALGSETQEVAVLQGQPNADFLTLFDCEEESLVKKLHNFGRIGEDKTVKYFWFHYEDIGVVTVEITLSNQQTGAIQTFIRTIGAGALPAERVLRDIFEVTMEGENIVVAFKRLADGGALSIIDYGFKYMPSEEMVGTYSNSKLINPAWVVDPTELLLIAFQCETPVVASADSEDFNCEEPAGVKNGLLLPFPTDQGQIPGFTYEKQVMRIFFHYEDLGVATVRVSVSTIRGQSTTQDVVIGTEAASGCLQIGVADLVVADEVIEVAFDKVDGPISIFDYTVKYDIKGERGKAEPVESLVGCETEAVGCDFTPDELVGPACPTDPLVVGVPFTYTFTVSGGTPPYGWAIVAGALPPGLTLDGNTGVLSGTPTTVGTYTYTVRVTDSGTPPQVVEIECELEVGSVFGASCPTEQPVLDTPYSVTLVATGGVGDLTWELISGSFPTGLTLDPSGEISGTPTETGTFVWAAQVTDSNDPPQTAVIECEFVLAVDGCPQIEYTLNPSTVVWTTTPNCVPNENVFSGGGSNVQMFADVPATQYPSDLAATKTQEVRMTFVSFVDGNRILGGGDACYGGMFVLRQIDDPATTNQNGYYMWYRQVRQTQDPGGLFNYDLVVERLDGVSSTQLFLDHQENLASSPYTGEFVLQGIVEETGTRVILTIGGVEIYNELDEPGYNCGAFGVGAMAAQSRHNESNWSDIAGHASDPL
jgi:hypothetical protein